MKTLFLGLGLITLLASGCAFSRTETQVNFNPKIQHPIVGDKKNTLALGNFTDSRTVQDKFVLTHKGNGYGTTSGAYVTKEPVADILKAGVAHALKENGFMGDTSKYELTADLQDFGGEYIQGFWSGTIKTRMTVRFELVEKGTSIPVWHDSFNGQTSKQANIVSSKLVGNLFSETATQLVERLLADKSFRNHFE